MKKVNYLFLFALLVIGLVSISGAFASSFDNGIDSLSDDSLMIESGNMQDSHADKASGNELKSIGNGLESDSYYGLGLDADTALESDSNYGLESIDN